MKYFIIFLSFFWGTNVLASDPSIFELPFGIVISKTTAEEIENRGVCEKRIEVRENYFRCEEYRMQGGFVVFMSQNELVSRVFFGGSSPKYPKKWRTLGVKDEMSIDAFLSVLERQGILNPEVIKLMYNPGCIPECLGIVHIEFEIADYLYTATFLSFADNDASREIRDDPNNFKLVKINVIETF